MTPELALSLSHEGIDLLLRSATGWDSMATVAPAASLPAQFTPFSREGQDAISHDPVLTRLAATVSDVSGYKCK